MPDGMTPHLNTALAASLLCRECGICCDGSLFARVSVYANEKDEVRAAGLDVYKTSKNSLVFDQKCGCLQGTKCTIYESRPKRCRTFYCGLQREVMNGSKSMEEARILVQAAKAHGAWILEWGQRHWTSSDDALNVRNILGAVHRSATDRGPKAALPVDRTFILRAFEYLKLIDRHFRETSLLQKFAELVQLNHRDEMPPATARRPRHFRVVRH